MSTPAKQPRKKKSNRSLFYRISAWLHLWLGLVTGIIVVIVCLTACIWVFNEEITDMMEPRHAVARQDKEVILPSKIMEAAAADFPGKRVTYATYRTGRVVEAGVGGRRGGSTIKLNPYTAEVVTKEVRKEGEVGFFRWILNGHRFLWMPYEIGRPIVNYSILIFLITLITGMVMWWPKKWNKSTRRQSFKIKWNGTVKRINYDLHNVLGFYTLLILFAIGATGIVYGLQWWSKGLYWATTGGKSLPEYVEKKSDSLQAGKHYTPEQAADIAFQTVIRKHPQANGFYMSFPDTSKPKSSILVIAYPDKGQYYNTHRYTFDQHTLAELKEPMTVYDGDFAEADFGTKLRKMNYDIHVGSILGLPGKVLAFFASLIGATLPVTGFIIWWGKKKKKKGPVKKAAAPKSQPKPAVAEMNAD
ncbi:PepSY-associated TM helix domain-containing protein [Chitinophaga pollutisoli]|uniref:PepSY-associated TM helix domain-containing protein n=1 Tax=Chitinophaga pollutisoli TaxID=3133966 RepID=A0ABZ2YSG1_9BACT